MVNSENLLVVVLVMMLLVVVLKVMGLLSLHLGMGLVIFGLRKKTARGSDDWCMQLPLDPHGLLRDSPRT